MENISNYTLIQLQKLINEIVEKHELLKGEIISDSNLMDEISRKINDKTSDLNLLEKLYIEVIEELDRR